MKLTAIFIGLFILCVSSTAYVKFHELESCKKSCCTTSEQSNNTCCGDVCSPFMKCQSTNVVTWNIILEGNYPPLLKHHSKLNHFFVVQLHNDLWRPPRV